MMSLSPRIENEASHNLIEQEEEVDLFVPKLSCYRWVCILMYGFIYFNLLMVTIGFSSVSIQLKTAFGVEQVAIVFLLVLPTIEYIPF